MMYSRARGTDLELDDREIKTFLKSVATKSDIDKLKIWALAGALAGSFAAILWLARLISQPHSKRVVLKDA